MENDYRTMAKLILGMYDPSDFKQRDDLRNAVVNVFGKNDKHKKAIARELHEIPYMHVSESWLSNPVFVNNMENLAIALADNSINPILSVFYSAFSTTSAFSTIYSDKMSISYRIISFVICTGIYRRDDLREAIINVFAKTDEQKSAIEKVMCDVNIFRFQIIPITDSRYTYISRYISQTALADRNRETYIRETYINELANALSNNYTIIDN
jgi:hypothetical protein